MPLSYISHVLNHLKPFQNLSKRESDARLCKSWQLSPTHVLRAGGGLPIGVVGGGGWWWGSILRFDPLQAPFPARP